MSMYILPDYLLFLNEQYDVLEDLSPWKKEGLKTYLAFFHSENTCDRLILKELDEKHTLLYRSLSEMWNPYMANVFYIHELSTHEENVLTTSVAAIEYAGDESLAQYVHQKGPLSASTALSVCIQLCMALSPLHSKGVIHRDIKPENIILYNPSDFHIKLIDFGSANVIPPTKSDSQSQRSASLYGDSTVVGTMGYQSPESFVSRTTNKSDVYSIGCVLNFLLTGTEPGIIRYKGNPLLRYILRKTINEDPSMRFHDLKELEGICRYGLRKNALSRIPLIRLLPGFRSQIRWKMVVASWYYFLMIYEHVILFLQYPIRYFLITFFFWVLIPLLVIGNLGYCCEYLPDKLRLNNMAMNGLKIITFLICFFVPIFFYF